MSNDFDIVISGGSMVGATLACALAESGLDIAVIEPSPVQINSDSDDFDLRVSAITHASQRIFQSLGVWDMMLSRRVSPFRDMHVWDEAGTGVIHFDSADIGQDTLGYIIENRVIQSALLQRLATIENVTLLSPAQLDTFEIESNQVRILLEEGTKHTARLLVGADGGNSRVRGQAGIASVGRDYLQTAVVATVKPEKFHQETAWQRFLQDGPLAFLPLTDGYCSIVWSTLPEHAEQLISMPEQQFLTELEQAFDSTLGRIETTGPRAAFPLKMFQAEKYVADRLALVGDAAHTIHPLAGQGVNLGLLDAAVLAEVVIEGIRNNRDIGSLSVLRKYERWRKGDNVSMMLVMDGFKRLFGNQTISVRLLRNIGMNVTNAMPVVKNKIIRRAMGLEGDLPHIAT